MAARWAGQSSQPQPLEAVMRLQMSKAHLDTLSLVRSGERRGAHTQGAPVDLRSGCPAPAPHPGLLVARTLTLHLQRIWPFAPPLQHSHGSVGAHTNQDVVPLFNLMAVHDQGTPFRRWRRSKDRDNLRSCVHLTSSSWLRILWWLLSRGIAYRLGLWPSKPASGSRRQSRRRTSPHPAR